MKKKKLTRSQERRQAQHLVESLAKQHAARTTIQIILFKAYMEAVRCYFGSNVPVELMEMLDKDLLAALQKAAEKSEDLDLLPIVRQAVEDFKAAEREQVTPEVVNE